jgi:hypothetical protein
METFTMSRKEVPRAGLVQAALAGRMTSVPGKRDGLYWPTQPGEPPSPLGDLVVRARVEGYRRSGDGPTPYHGYLYRILTAQGPAAPGGAYDYVVRGHMIAGFALVAFPAEYGVSGVMTFIVNHDGIVYQKDLGPRTRALALAMRTFDPDDTWTKVDVPQVAAPQERPRARVTRGRPGAYALDGLSAGRGRGHTEAGVNVLA